MHYLFIHPSFTTCMHCSLYFIICHNNNVTTCINYVLACIHTACIYGYKEYVKYKVKCECNYTGSCRYINQLPPVCVSTGAIFELQSNNACMGYALATIGVDHLPLACASAATCCLFGAVPTQMLPEPCRPQKWRKRNRHCSKHCHSQPRHQ